MIKIYSFFLLALALAAGGQGFAQCAPAPVVQGYQYCEGSTIPAGQGLQAAPPIPASLTIPISVTAQPGSEPDGAPGIALGTGAMPALPAGATVASVTITYNGVDPLQAAGSTLSWQSEVRLGLSGAITLAGIAGTEAANNGDVFNYTATSSPTATTVAGGAINLTYWESTNDDAFGPDAFFPTGSLAATVTINYYVPGTIGVASDAQNALSVPFNIAAQPGSEPLSAPGLVLGTGNMLPVPAGVTVSSVTITCNGIDPLGTSWQSDVRLGLSGAITLAGAAGAGAVNNGSVFNYTATSGPTSVTGAGGAINLTYWESYNDISSGPDATFATGSAAAFAAVNYTTPNLAGIEWYTAATGGSPLATGTVWNPLTTAGSGITSASAPGTYTFYAGSLYNGCSSPVRTAVVFTILSSAVQSFSACPTNIAVNTAAGTCAQTASYTATATTAITYALSGATTGSGSGTGSGLSFNKGITNVVLSTSGICSPAVTCSFQVTVTDNENPTVTAPASFTTACFSPALLGTPVYSDNCAGVTISNDAPATFPPGNTTVTWTATDASGNTATATQVVTYSTAPIVATTPVVSADQSFCEGGMATLMAGGLAPGGQVADFTGAQAPASDYIPTLPNTFSIDLWVNPGATRAPNTPFIYGTDGISGQRYAIFPKQAGTNGAAGLSVGTNGISVFEHGNNYLPSLLVYNAPVNGWTHVTLVYTAKKPSLYVNGVLVGTGLTSTRPTVYPSTGTGGSYGPYIGSIDNVRIWDGALTAADIATISTSETLETVGGKNAVAHYAFNGGSVSSSVSGAPAWNAPSANPDAAFYTYTWSGAGAPTASASETQTTGALTSPQTYTVTAAANCYLSPASAAVAVDVLPNGQWRGTSADWNTAANWCGGVPTATTDVIIPDATTVPNMPVMSVDGDARNIALQPGAALALTNNEQLNLHGNITGTGTLDAANGHVVFAGSGAQSIAPPFTTQTLTVDGGGTKTLDANVTLTTGLQFNNGLLDVGGSTLSMGTAPITGADENRYVKTSQPSGRLSMAVGTGAVFFPVGNATYNPAQLSNTGTADTFAVGVRDEVLAEGATGSPINPATTPAVNRTWDVAENTPGGSNAMLVVQWSAANTNSPSFDYTNVYISHYTGSSWDNDPAYPDTYNTPTAGGWPGAGPYSASRSGITSFSPFSVGSAGGTAPLPVTLISIKAGNEGSRNRIEWESASEHNADYYVVERSTDGRTFSRMGELAAQGKPWGYIAYDNAPAQGFTYYRLKMVDADGSFAYSQVVKALYQQHGEVVVEAYPNPVTDVLNIRTYGAEAGSIAIHNAAGQQVATGLVDKGAATISTGVMAAGMYYLRFTDAHSGAVRNVMLLKR